MAKKRIGELLVESGLITEEQLSKALESKASDEKLGEVLIREGCITEQQLIEVLELQLGIPYIHLFQYPIEKKATELVPKELAKKYKLMPVRINENKLVVAMTDPMDYFAIEELRMVTGMKIMPVLATTEELLRTINKHYDLQDSINEVMGEYSPQESPEETVIEDEDSAIIRLVNQIITDAVIQHASDIHIDPQESDIIVRYRIDGLLRTERELPKYMQNVFITRIKIIGGLDITETRLPQDGRISMVVNNQSIDIRLSSLPSVHGEKIVMRILDISKAINDLNSLGFTEENLKNFTDMIKKTNGIVLLTGPTGSGKTSTLYAALNKLNKEEVNIITLEDPVEYKLNGINQVEVREEIGMTFAQALRAILRQDPDIIMVGEIRDTETGRIAIRSSLTGHLVLSTLHTNSSIGALTRLIDMGIEPFLLSSSLNGIVAQRLVRRVCPDCSEEKEPASRERHIFEQYDITADFVRRGKGCPSCGMTGYRGRIAIHELLSIDRKMRELILKPNARDDIHQYVKEKGMQFLIHDGLKKAAAGITTTEEVLRAALQE